MAAKQVKKAKIIPQPAAAEVTSDEQNTIAPPVKAVKPKKAAPAKKARAAVEEDDDDDMHPPAVLRPDLVDGLDGSDDPEVMPLSVDEDDSDVLAPEPTAQWLVGSEAATNEEKRRKAVVPPQHAAAGLSLFEYLRTCTPPLDQKIVDIAIAQTQVPLELRLDAAQEIRLVWSTMTPDLARYRPGQIASYAHRMAKHTALRVRRELGSSVRLPGSAFRKRRDGSSYVTPGVLSVALDWNELEGWLDMDSAGSSSEESLVMNMGLGIGEEDALAELGGMVEASSAEDNEEEMLKFRLQVIERFKDELTERQYQILMRLSRGDTYEEIQAALGIKKGVMMRELNLAACVIGPL